LKFVKNRVILEKYNLIRATLSNTNTDIEYYKKVLAYVLFLKIFYQLDDFVFIISTPIDSNFLRFYTNYKEYIYIIWHN